MLSRESTIAFIPFCREKFCKFSCQTVAPLIEDSKTFDCAKFFKSKRKKNMLLPLALFRFSVKILTWFGWKPVICRIGGIGRHDGFKIHCQQWHPGSTPGSGTVNFSFLMFLLFLSENYHSMPNLMNGKVFKIVENIFKYQFSNKTLNRKNKFEKKLFFSSLKNFDR